MKIVKYGHGMKCQKWYKTECSHCHTIFKASPFEVAFMERCDEETTHPTPIYKTTCPVCEYTDIYKLKKKEKKKKDKSECSLFRKIWWIIVIFVSSIFAIISLSVECSGVVGPAGATCIVLLMLIGIISLFFILLKISN